MFFGMILIAVLAVWWGSNGLNKWLPNYIQKQELWLVDLFYRWLNVLAPFFLLYSVEILQFHFPSLIIGLILYGAAYWIKKLTWQCLYWEWLK